MKAPWIQEFFRIMLSSDLRIRAIFSQKGFSQAYIFITCTPEIISDMTRTRSSVRTVVWRRNFAESLPVYAANENKNSILNSCGL